MGPRDADRPVLTPILDAARLSGLKVTIYYETAPAPRTGRSAAEDLLTVLRHYAKHPAWLTVGGKPVVFVYGRALGEIGLPGWLAAIDLVNHEYPGGAVFLGDDPSRVAARVFDGIHTYNTAGSLTGKSEPQVRQWARQTYPSWVHAADSFGRISAITVIPGYDDTKIRKPGLRVDRLAGRTLPLSVGGGDSGRPSLDPRYLVERMVRGKRDRAVHRIRRAVSQCHGGVRCPVQKQREATPSSGRSAPAAGGFGWTPVWRAPRCEFVSRLGIGAVAECATNTLLAGGGELAACHFESVAAAGLCRK